MLNQLARLSSIMLRSLSATDRQDRFPIDIYAKSEFFLINISAGQSIWKTLRGCRENAYPLYRAA
jgi:hypothetical protein